MPRCGEPTCEAKPRGVWVVGVKVLPRAAGLHRAWPPVSSRPVGRGSGEKTGVLVLQACFVRRLHEGRAEAGLEAEGCFLLGFLEKRDGSPRTLRESPVPAPLPFVLEKGQVHCSHMVLCSAQGALVDSAASREICVLKEGIVP